MTCYIMHFLVVSLLNDYLLIIPHLTRVFCIYYFRAEVLKTHSAWTSKDTIHLILVPRSSQYKSEDFEFIPSPTNQDIAETTAIAQRWMNALNIAIDNAFQLSPPLESKKSSLFKRSDSFSTIGTSDDMSAKIRVA